MRNYDYTILINEKDLRKIINILLGGILLTFIGVGCTIVSLITDQNWFIETISTLILGVGLAVILGCVYKINDWVHGSGSKIRPGQIDPNEPGMVDPEYPSSFLRD